MEGKATCLCHGCTKPNKNVLCNIQALLYVHHGLQQQAKRRRLLLYRSHLKAWQQTWHECNGQLKGLDLAVSNLLYSPVFYLLTLDKPRPHNLSSFLSSRPPHFYCPCLLSSQCDSHSRLCLRYLGPRQVKISLMLSSTIQVGKRIPARLAYLARPAVVCRTSPRTQVEVDGAKTVRVAKISSRGRCSYWRSRARRQWIHPFTAEPRAPNCNEAIFLSHSVPPTCPFLGTSRISSPSVTEDFFCFVCFFFLKHDPSGQFCYLEVTICWRGFFFDRL